MMPCYDPACARCSEHHGGFKFPLDRAVEYSRGVVPADVELNAGWDFYYGHQPGSIWDAGQGD